MRTKQAVSKSERFGEALVAPSERHVGIAVIAVLSFATPSRPAMGAPVPGASIEIWLRGLSKQDGEGAERLRQRRFNLDRLPLRDVERRDAQYDEVRQYRGILLGDILKRYGPDESIDLAILHFANGMAVPVAFRDEATMRRLKPFIARASLTRRGGALSVGKFPAIPKTDAPGDRRRIEFAGNKVVVAERWHREVAQGTQPGLSPWGHVDTLVGVELVVSKAYYAQFEPSREAAVQRGLTLFRQNCQFCHGLRHVGATFGWDLESDTVINYRDSAAHLYHNTTYRPQNAAELGLMMPALSFLTEADAAAIRAWLLAASPGPLPRYAPPVSAK
jgi:mono/diheme cytochrome c family protein